MKRSPQLESHIVVVDSRPGDYHDLACWAGEQQWHVHLLTTAQAAIKFKRREQGDVWIVNALLADMSGFALCEELDMRSRGTPVFIVSDRYDVAHERLACQRGAAYLAKGAGHSIDCRWHLERLKGGQGERETAHYASSARQPPGGT